MANRFYLDIDSYLSGHERTPFQERILPAFLLRPMLQSRLLLGLFNRMHGLFLPPWRGALFLISIVALAVAGYFCLLLYDALSNTRSLQLLVYPVFLFAVLWSYMVLVQQPFSYPYDMLSLAFFTAGLYFIYQRRFLPLLLIVLIGTFNRETTLFLIGIFVIDAISVRDTAARLRDRIDLRRIPWLKALVLTVVWAAIKLTLHRKFLHNPTENELRIHENLHYFAPKHLPALLNICGYLVPVVLLLRRQLRPARFANYLLILPVWFLVMFLTGVLLETRIYGELSAYAAISTVLLLESHLATRQPDLQTKSADSALKTAGCPPAMTH
ncbi:MAG: hypothetical protein KGK08_10445 [Acidobacteriota bacterium]|nr:hypothetical protein [Acidobacteriota bacterium]